MNNNELRGALTVLKKHIFEPLQNVEENLFAECTNANTHTLPEFYPAQLKISISNYLEKMDTSKLRKDMEPYINLVSEASNEINLPVYIDFSELAKISYYEIAVISETIATLNRNNQNFFLETDQPLTEMDANSLSKVISSAFKARRYKKKLDIRALAKKLYTGLIENIELTEDMNLKDMLIRWNNGHKSLGLFINIADKSLELMAEATSNQNNKSRNSYSGIDKNGLAFGGSNAHL